MTLADLTAGGATQYGVSSDDYGPGCPDTGNGCVNFYAVSIPGVTPSGDFTWFQAAAALGTPDGAPCIVSAAGRGSTGTAGCVSDVGAFDMVGNLWEWVADWVPQSTICPGWGGFSDDRMCLAGADTTGGPGALLRGGYWNGGSDAGVLPSTHTWTPCPARAAASGSGAPASRPSPGLRPPSPTGRGSGVRVGPLRVGWP